MKLSELFYEEWNCVAWTDDPCWQSDSRRPPGHEKCGIQYNAKLNEEEFSRIKDLEIPWLV